MNNTNHKVEYWDSRLSGKKKLALDDKVISMTEDVDNYVFAFKISSYNFIVQQKEDEKPRLTINNRDFNELIKDERSGKLHKERENYNNQKSKKEIKKNKEPEDDYYKRALKYNGDNYVEGNDGEIYDIEEQRKRLEEFEKKKEKENAEKNRKKQNNNFNNKDSNNNTMNNNKKKKFILNADTVQKNFEIINNINNVFDDDNLLDLNDNIFSSNNTQSNKFNNNINYDFGQNDNINNNNNNKNNQEVINNFLANMESNDNNNDFNFNNQYNDNYMNQNNINYNQNQNNNNYNDDFNPFDD